MTSRAKRRTKATLPVQPEASTDEAVTLDSVSTDLLELLSVGAKALRTELQTIIDEDEDENAKYDKASRIAFVLSKAGPVGDTIRKMQAAEKKRLDLDIVKVVAFLRTQPPDDIARVIRELQQITARGNRVLG